jgi:alpha-1,2-mannosyltransferase
MAGPSSMGFLADRRELATAARLLLAIEAVIFAFCVLGTHGLVTPLAKPTSTDFVSFYAAGRLADAGAPQLAYNHAAHYAAEERATQTGISYNYFYYPPPFLLLCAALARLPYLVAFIGFETITLVIYILTVQAILGKDGWQNLFPILAFPPILWTIGFGQNGLLTAGLFGAATLLIDRRPLAAGLLFGALIGKPHFAVLVPVALVAGGRWRAIAGALCSAASLCLLSLFAFGARTWLDFFAAAAASPNVYASGRIAFAGFVTPFGGAMQLGAGPTLAAILQAGASAVAAVVVGVVWRRNLPLPARAASLAAATLVTVPLALFYDLVLDGIAAAWLLRAGGEYRLPPPAQWLLAGLYFLCLNPRGLAVDWHLPIGPLIALTTLMLTVIVALHRQKMTGVGPISPVGRVSRRQKALVQSAAYRTDAALLSRPHRPTGPTAGRADDKLRPPPVVDGPPG